MADIDLRPGCVLRGRGGSRWELAKPVQGQPDCFDSSWGVNTVEHFKKTWPLGYAVLLPSPEALTAEPSLVIAWAWDALKGVAISRELSCPADDAVWLWRYGDTDDQIGVATVWVRLVYPNDIQVAFDADTLQYPSPMHEAYNVLMVASEWVNSVYRRRDLLLKGLAK